jgi:hypothetical protein
VAAIEAFGQPQDGRQRANGPSPFAAEVAVAFVPPAGCGPAVIPRDERHRFDLVGLEAAQIAVFDQVVRVLVMAVIRNVHADIMEQRCILEPFAAAVGERMNAARLIEEAGGEARDLRRVLRRVIAPLGQLDDAPPPHVGVAIGLRDLLPVPCDVVEHETLAKGEVAERQLGRAEAPQDRFQQNRACRRQVGAPRIEAGHPQSLVEG